MMIINYPSSQSSPNDRVIRINLIISTLIVAIVWRCKGPIARGIAFQVSL